MLDFLQRSRSMRTRFNLRDLDAARTDVDFESDDITTSTRLEEILSSINDVFDHLATVEPGPDS